MIEDLWYKNTVIYSLDLETYLDSSGDGTGDFEGLVRRLDYLDALGIDTLWLAPFQPTPNRDNGYDVSDFYGVDPRHGSSGDFVEFMWQARQRGIRVIIDLVANHTSDQHRWFQEARRDKGSPYRDWYVWSKELPPGWNKGMVFPGEQETTWTYDEEAGEYYFHRFYSFQPDLNMDNPQVRTEIRRIMGYWLQLGVAGFRVDAVPFLLETLAVKEGRFELRSEYLQEMRRFLQWRRGDALLLGEANVPPGETERFFGKGDGLHMMFNFWVNQHLFHTLATGDAGSLADALRATRKLPPNAQWAHFLRNHDELDLGRLTDEQREQVFARFAPEENMQIYGRGIRRRLATMLGDARQIRLANSLLFSLPGTPVIRYGDEIGMGDDLSLPARDAVRTPMQWSDGPQAGFSPSRDTIHPVISQGPCSYHRVNVEDQRRDPESLLSWTGKMIRLRKECPEIGWGDWEILPAGSPHVLALRYDWRGSSIVVLHNFDEKPHEAHLQPHPGGGDRLTNLLVDEQLEGDSGGTYRIPLETYGYRWYRIGGMMGLLQREKG